MRERRKVPVPVKKRHPRLFDLGARAAIELFFLDPFDQRLFPSAVSRQDYVQRTGPPRFFSCYLVFHNGHQKNPASLE